MKKIVLSAIAAVVVTVGTYHIALLAGAREPAAAALTALVFAAVALTAVAFAAGFIFAAAFDAFAVAVAAAVAFAVAAVAAFAFTAVAFAAFAAAAAVAAFAAKEEHLKFRWVFGAYVAEALVIVGALAVGSPG